MYTNYNVNRSNGTSSLSRYATGNSQYGSSYASSYSRKSSALPSKPKVSLYSSTYSTSYSPSTASNKDVIRPHTRYHSDDFLPSRRTRDGDQSMPRSRTDYTHTTSLNDRGRDMSTRRKVNASCAYRDNSLPRRRAPSPATRKANPVPEFTTIRSSSKPKVGRSTSLDRFARTSNPITPIEAKRTILKNDDQVRGMDSYSPSFYENGTSKNNRDHIDKVSLPSRSSNSSQRDEHYQNGYAESSSSTPHDFNDPNAGLIGLKNIGNTCFMNSIIQCLSNTKLLRHYCLNEKYSPDINPKSPLKGKLIQAFSEIVSHLWYPSKSGNALSTSGFKSQIQKFSKRFSGYEQQDSQEFLRFLIEGLHEDVNKVTEKRTRTMPNFDSLCEESKAEKTWQFYLSKDNSFIVDLFMGQLKSSLECQECRHVSVTFDPFWDLSLPLPKNSYRSYESSVTVTSCLANFTKEEILDRDERPTCDKCKCRRRMTKKFTIHKFPKILVIHLKRFSEGSYRQKLTVDVDFSHKLKISQPVSTSDASFHLYGVSNHSGSCYGGHYTAYCKNPETKRWHCFSDSLVSSMSESSVQSREAYVLFYEQLSSRSHL